MAYKSLKTSGKIFWGTLFLVLLTLTAILINFAILNGTNSWDIVSIAGLWVTFFSVFGVTGRKKKPRRHFTDKSMKKLADSKDSDIIIY